MAKRLSQQDNFDDVYEDEIVEPNVEQTTNVAVVKKQEVFKIPETAHKPPAPPKHAKKMQNTVEKNAVEVKLKETKAVRFSKLQALAAVEAQKRATAAIKKAEKKAELKEKVLNKAISDLEEKKKMKGRSYKRV